MRFVVLLLLLSISPVGWASDPFQHPFPGYVVLYNTFNSTALSSEIANQYGLKRSEKIDTLNIAVQAKKERQRQPVDALLKGKVTNFYQQQQNLDFQRVKEGEYIYFIAQYRVTDETPLQFHLYIRPDGHDRTLELKFKRPLP